MGLKLETKRHFDEGSDQILETNKGRLVIEKDSGQYFIFYPDKKGAISTPFKTYTDLKSHIRLNYRELITMDHVNALMQQFIKVQAALVNNTSATDDDLKETWGTFKSESKTLIKELNAYIKARD